MSSYIIFGGSFDPIHNGHLRIAREASLKLNADVIFLPAKNPRWKDDVTPVEYRLKMLKLAMKYAPSGSFISSFEIKSKAEINYSIDSVKYFANKYKRSKLYFLIGADQVEKFHEWKDAKEISELTQIVYVNRNGFELKTDNIKKFKMIDLNYDKSGEVASHDIKNLKSLDVPHEILTFIEKNNLYYINKLSNYIDFKRLLHSIEVAKLAYKIALVNNLENPGKFYVAGILHDVGKLAKINSNENAVEYIKKHYEKYLKLPPFSYHQFIGADIAKTDFKIDDEDILDAIKFHCTGKANMTTLGMVVYAADKIEPTRQYDSRFLINSSLKNWKQGFLDTLSDNKKYLLAHNKDISNFLTDECFEMYLKGE